MKLKTLQSIRLAQKRRVLLRTDFNIGMTGNELEKADLWKLKQTLPTIQNLLRKKASIIIVSSRGRPRGHDHDLTLRPMSKKLSQLLKHPVTFRHGDLSDYKKLSNSLKPLQIVCLENIRFFNEETENDAHFGKQLAQLADHYVDDAFGNIHRSHASMLAVTRYVPSYAGLLVQDEVGHLQGLLEKARRPIVAVIGGNKISTKIRLIRRLLNKVDWVLLGGALANTVLAAMDYKVGRSIIEEDMRSWSMSILHNKLKVPLDARVAHSFTAKTSRLAAIGAVRNKEMILDLGPETVAFYSEIIAKAKTVIWNGPLGYFEDTRFAQGTRNLVKVIAKATAQSYVGGGETVKAVLAAQAEDSIHFVSTGGGAMLALLEGRPLPALQALYKK